MATIQTTRAAVSTTDPQALLNALQEQGFTGTQLAKNPEILAWVAKHNVGAKGANVELPTAASRQAVIKEVQANPRLYADAMEAATTQLRAFKAQFGAGAAAAPTTSGAFDPGRGASVATNRAAATSGTRSTMDTIGDSAARLWEHGLARPYGSFAGGVNASLAGLSNVAEQLTRYAGEKTGLPLASAEQFFGNLEAGYKSNEAFWRERGIDPSKRGFDAVMHYMYSGLGQAAITLLSLKAGAASLAATTGTTLRAAGASAQAVEAGAAWASAAALPLQSAASGAAQAIEAGAADADIAKSAGLGLVQGALLQGVLQGLGNIPRAERLVLAGGVFGGPVLQAELQKPEGQRDYEKVIAETLIGMGLSAQGPGKTWQEIGADVRAAYGPQIKTGAAALKRAFAAPAGSQARGAAATEARITEHMQALGLTARDVEPLRAHYKAEQVEQLLRASREIMAQATTPERAGGRTSPTTAPRAVPAVSGGAPVARDLPLRDILTLTTGKQYSRDFNDAKDLAGFVTGNRTSTVGMLEDGPAAAKALVEQFPWLAGAKELPARLRPGANATQADWNKAVDTWCAELSAKHGLAGGTEATLSVVSRASTNTPRETIGRDVGIVPQAMGKGGATADKPSAPVSWSKAEPVIDRNLTALKSASPEAQMAAIGELGGLRVDPKSFGAAKPGDYNGKLMGVVDQLGELVKSSPNANVRDAALEALSKYSRGVSGDYKLGFVGRRAPEVLEDLYYNTALPDSVRRQAYDEMHFAYRQNGMDSGAPFQTAVQIKAAEAKAAGPAATASATTAATLSWDNAAPVIDRSVTALKSTSTEAQMAAIRELGGLRVDLNSFGAAKPVDYNGKMMGVVDQLSTLVTSTPNADVRKAAFEALSSYSRSVTGDYKLGYVGRRAPEVIQDLYLNVNLPDPIRRQAFDEMHYAFRQSDMDWPETFQTAAQMKAAEAKMTGQAVPASATPSAPVSWSKAEPVIDRNLTALKSASPEAQMAAIGELGGLRVDPKSFGAAKPGDYNGKLMGVVDQLGELVKSSPNTNVRDAAFEALSKYSRSVSGDYKLGFVGRRAPEVLEDLYYNTALPDSVRRQAYDELHFAQQQLGWDSGQPFKTAAEMTAGKGKPAGQAAPTSASVSTPPAFDRVAHNASYLGLSRDQVTNVHDPLMSMPMKDWPPALKQYVQAQKPVGGEGLAFAVAEWIKAGNIQDPSGLTGKQP